MSRLDVFNVNDFIAQRKKKGQKKTGLEWGNNELHEVFNADKFSPSNQQNYYTTFNNKLYNPDEFKKYWGRKKNIKGIYQEDIDNDGYDDYIAVDNENNIIGFNNQIILNKKNSLYPYQRNYYKQDKDYRSKNSFNQFLDSQETIEGYEDITDRVTRRQNQAWYGLYTVFQATEELTNIATPKQLESAAKKFYELGKYILTPKELDSSVMEPLLKKALFKEIYENTIISAGSFITVFNLIPQTVLHCIKNKFKGFKEFCVKNEIFDPLRLSKEDVEKIYAYYKAADEQTVPAYRQESLANNWYNQQLIAPNPKVKPQPPRFTKLEQGYEFKYNKDARNKKLAKKD